MIREISKNVLICALFFIITGLGYYNVFGISESSNTKYKYYSDDLITVDNDGRFDALVNIVDNDYVGVLVSSDLSTSGVVSVTVTFYDADGKELSSNKSSSMIFANNHTFLTFLLPDLTNQYAGNIEVVITGEEYSGITYDVSNILYESTPSNPFAIQVTNNNNFSIMNLVFDVVALKDKKVVLYEAYREKNVMPYSIFSVFSDTLTNMNEDYDELLIFTTSVEKG